MTQEEVKALKLGDSVGIQNRPNGPIIDGTVMQSGPRVDADGKPLPFTLDLLVVQLGAGPTQMSWEPDNFPDGISQLVKAETA